MSLQFMKAWTTHIQTVLPPMTGEKWVKQKNGTEMIQWFYKDGDLKTQAQKQAYAFKWQLSLLFDKAWLTRYPHMLLYVCESSNQLPKCFDYNASVRMKNGRPIFESLWVSPSLKKLLKNVNPLHMQQDVKPTLKFWSKAVVRTLCPEYIFRVPQEYQKEDYQRSSDLD